MNTTNNRNDFYKEQLDKTLNGNEKIETAIAALQKESTEEMLAHTLTVIRHRRVQPDCTRPLHSLHLSR